MSELSVTLNSDYTYITTGTNTTIGTPYSAGQEYITFPPDYFNVLSGVGLLNESLSQITWSGNSMATIYKMRVMCHGSHDEFNDTMNLTFGRSSDRSIYISEIGIYNEDNVLLGTAKLSKPIKKNFGDEVTVELNYDF